MPEIIRKTRVQNQCFDLRRSYEKQYSQQILLPCIIFQVSLELDTSNFGYNSLAPECFVKTVKQL